MILDFLARHTEFLLDNTLSISILLLVLLIGTLIGLIHAKKKLFWIISLIIILTVFVYWLYWGYVLFADSLVLY